ncbi:MAG: lipoprotein-releasing ABC transporter permease subunit [Gammaproteobacteria bacterium]|nr:lipoprotein-releasing ABC transporter permease subunit [Gammaproteobacteria bacterium]
MLNTVALSLGGRYAFSRRSSISFVSLVASGGLALSVAVLIIVVSVVNGFERELRERVFGVLPHLSFYGREPLPGNAADLDVLRALDGVRGVVPVVQGAGLAAVPSDVAGVLITGIDPLVHGEVSTLEDYLVGSPVLRAGEFSLVLGIGVARELGVEIGERITLVLPSATVTPVGIFPRQKRFVLRGILQSRSEIDSRSAYIHINDAQKVFRLGGRIHGYQVKLQDLFAASSIAAQGVSALGPQRVFARSWMSTHGNLYRAIGMQKATMFVLLSFLVAVAAFNLVSTLVMIVDQRSGDVAILRTLGSNRATLVLAFVVVGILLGGSGIVIGVILGVLIASGLPDFYQWATNLFSLDLMNQYFVSYLPVEIRRDDIVGIVLTAMILCLLSTIYPAWRAAGLRPSEVLAHE